VLIVRLAEVSDAEELALMNSEFNDVKALPQLFRAVLSTPDATETIFVALSDQVLVGFLCLQVLRSACYEKPTVEVTELYVRPSARRNGVAGAMLQHALQWSSSCGASEAIVRTNVGNTAARNAFTRWGFAETGHVVYRLGQHAV
jgi:GNAT superfamily N-acetyltransferase